jgi:hypothetical protein
MELEIRSTEDLNFAELELLRAMQKLWFGHFERVKIDAGELILNPWPKAVKSVKFGGKRESRPIVITEPFELCKQQIEFFSEVRKMARGRIEMLQVQEGLPVHAHFASGGAFPDERE